MPTQLPLRDIHIPEAISWWPPAIGWWLAIIATGLTIALVWWLIRRLLKPNPVKTAKKMLNDIAADSLSEDMEKLEQISALLRRVSISIAPRSQAASLTGTDWLHYLDKSLLGSPFSEGAGRCLLDAHYRKSTATDIDIDALIQLSKRWLKAQKI